MKTKRILLTAVFAPIFASTVASAGPILWVGDSSGTLGTVDVSAGTATVLGNMGAVMTDIAFDNSGNLYGTTFTQLYSINTTTGASTLIGNHNLGGNKNSLVFDDSGNLFAASNSLYTLSTTTGAATLVGSGGGVYNSSGDLAFIGDHLYLSSTGAGNDFLVELNESDGSGTFIGNIGYSGVYGMATDNNIDLYGVTGTNVLSIDTLTGAGTLLSDFGGYGIGTVWGTAFYAESGAPDPGIEPTNPVPEPTTMILLGAGLVGIVGFNRRKKK